MKEIISTLHSFCIAASAATAIVIVMWVIGHAGIAHSQVIYGEPHGLYESTLGTPYGSDTGTYAPSNTMGNLYSY